MNSNQFMKERPVLPLLTSMALPMVISMAVNALYNIIDSYFVAQISEEALTALSLVYPVQNLINAIAIGFGVGVNAVIAFHLGAGDSRSANVGATLGLVCSALHGVIVTAASIAVMPFFLGLFTEDETVLRYGVQYATIAFAFGLIIMLNLYFEKVLQAVGRMKTTMVALMCGFVSNIILDPLLIWGVGFLPQMGVAGAALATGLGQLLTLAFYLVVYATQKLPVRVGREFLVFDRKTLGKLYAVGIPAILNQALPSLLISALNGILSAYSQAYVVVLGVYYKLQTFLYLPANGIVQGLRPLIGYNYGAGEYGRVRQLYRTTLCMNGVIMALGTVISLTAAEPLIGLFAQTPETAEIGTRALHIICAGFLASAVSVTTSGALEGLGKGAASLVISLLRYVVVILPVAFLLCRLFGPEGVWHAFWVTELVAAAAAALVYRKTVRL
ncbi:MAG: MATE family efflux transporter [Clostridiales bacterium]|nr:MATE family efflux transporter [Clostridiales bacterium]